jgi:hypothetical protein
VAHDAAASRKPVATEGAIKYRRLVLLQNESLGSRNMPRQCLCSLTEKASADKVFSSSYDAIDAMRHQRLVSCDRASFSVEKTRGFCPRQTWTKPFVFLHGLTVYQRCVVFCTLATGTPVGHTILTIVYMILTRKQPSQDLGAAYIDQWNNTGWSDGSCSG